MDFHLHIHVIINVVSKAVMHYLRESFDLFFVNVMNSVWLWMQDKNYGEETFAFKDIS